MNDDTGARRRALAGLAALPLWAVGMTGCAVGDSGPAPGAAAPGRAASKTRSSPAQGSHDVPALPADAAGARYLLLGELHDNPQLHRLRLAWLRQLAAETRFALAMEQFDAAMQQRLDAARAGLRDDGVTGEAKSRRLAQAAGFSFDGWDWTLYEPVVSFALRHELPLVAANLSNSQAAAVARGRDTSIDASPPAGWSAADASAMQAAIRDGHCGLLPDSALPGMVRAQLARDRTMARTICEASLRTGLPVVLLAGNGHVRADIGVPRHLAEFDGDASIVALGLGEDGAPPAGRFDGFWGVAPVSRPDPCAALREHFGGQRR